MVPAAAFPPSVERLTGELFDGALADPMAIEMSEWMAGSRRFRAFVDTHRDKIRKKLRGASDPEARKDVRTELCAARLLLSDRRIELAFEAYGSTARGPDFTASFRGERDVNLEVTRLRRTADAAGGGGWLLTKLRQLPPSAANAVVAAIPGRSAAALDVAALIGALKMRADAGDQAFFEGRGLDGPRAFSRALRRLGAVLVWCEDGDGDGSATLWTNPSARIPLPERVARACLQSLRGI
jgi:hypothetical protein